MFKTKRTNRELHLEIESLEPREMLATGVEISQEVAYIINRARSNPQAYARSIGRANLLNAVDASQPLAWNSSMASAARWKSNDIVVNNSITPNNTANAHIDSRGRTPTELLADFNYDIDQRPGGRYNGPESLALGHDTPADIVELLIVDEGVTSLGHRRHLLSWDSTSTGTNAYHNEIGVGFHAGNNRTAFRNYTTIHAFRSDYQAQYLTGVVFDDANNNNRYNAGEGYQTTVRVNGQTVNTNSAGGWSLEVDPNTTYLVESQGTRVSVNVADKNRQVDFERNTDGGWVDFRQVPEVEREVAPTDLQLSSTSVNENATAAEVGRVTVTDANANDTHTFQLSDDRFQVTGGRLRLRAGERLDHEAAARIPLTITVTDSTNRRYSENFSISVNDRNERPLDISLSSTSINAEEPGAAVGRLTVSDPDVGDSHTYTVSDNRFEVSGNQLRLKTGRSLGRGTDSLTLDVTARDSGNLTRTEAFTIRVDKEIDGTYELSARTLRGNTAAAVVGNVRMINETGVSRSDFDFSISDDRFEIDNNMLLRLKPGVQIDAATTRTVTFSIACPDCETTVHTITVLPGFGQADVRNGVLRINGTNRDDVYSVFRVGNEILFANGSSLQRFTGITSIVVDGQAGNDRLVLGSSLNVGASIYGRSGNDTIIGTPRRDDLRGGTGNDLIISLDGGDMLFGDHGDDDLQSGINTDTLIGGDGRDRLTGGAGNDLVFGGFGNDVLFGVGGVDRLNGEDGDDLIYGGPGNDIMKGGNGKDTLSAHQGNDTVEGGTGNDKLFGGEDNDTIRGNEGHDELLGFSGNDRLYGGDGNDKLFGGDDEDRLFGEDGADKIFGGRHDDEAFGQDGNDEIFGGLGNDMISGGLGENRLFGNQGNDELIGHNGNDYLNGGSEHDLLIGNAGNDELYGLEGNDILIGGAGGDLLSGFDGEDLLIEGRTTNDANATARSAMLRAWSSTQSISNRRTQLRAQGISFGSKVVADDSEDTLRGNKGTDWFFATDLEDHDQVTGSEFIDRP